MSIVAAFVIGGAICVLFQLISAISHSTPPNILIVGIGAGALFTAFGVIGALGDYGEAGVYILVIGLGQAVFYGVVSALEGNWLSIGITVLVLGCFILIGVIGGAWHLALHKHDKDDTTEIEET
ncbi:MAG: SpoVA/SpoVAEb family sporulation membrane protein [Eggerthellaceae bacterium]|nr:SpoVA/SpoVAEb family sporulation membrane protein [Eggerthellaceae bacterium]